MYQLFIGCDMSKDKFDVSYFYQGNTIYLGEFVNNIKGYKELLSQLEQLNISKSKMFICFENTGVYSKEFYIWLVEQGVSFKQENALQISNSIGTRRGKSDKADSKDICLYAYKNIDWLQPSKAQRPSIEKLKDLISRRKILEKQRKALKVSLNVKKKTMDKELYKDMQFDNKILIEYYDTLIKKAEKKIKQVIKEDEKLNKNAKLCQSVIGIGPLITATILTRTNNFTDIDCARKLSCYAGIAPFSKSSGQFKGAARVSKIGDKYLKSLLSNGARAAVSHDKELKNYFDRKKQEGKHYGKVMNAIKNKLIHRVFAVVKRGTPFVKLNQYA